MSTWTSTPATDPERVGPPRRRLAIAGFLGVSLILGMGCVKERGTIGAILVQTSERRLEIQEVPSGLSADRGGVQARDEVLLIDGRDVRGMNAEQVHRMLGGEVGEPVKLTLIRGDRVVRVTLTRTPARRHRTNHEKSPAAPR